MDNAIQIGFAIDKNFGKFAGVTITSLAYSHIGDQLDIHIIYDDILEQDMYRLQQTEQLFRNLTIHFHQINTADMEFVVPPGHITQAMYYRYMFAQMLPEDIKRIIYLDADIICRGSLRPLWELDLQDKYLGAVGDFAQQKSCERIGLKNGRYFNSGVLLMNLEKWRAEQLAAELFRWLQEVSSDTIIWGDQDALNAIIDGEFIEIAQKFNCILVNNTDLKACEDTVIIHYIDYAKPWHKYYLETVEKKLYWRYVARSLWYDMKPTDGTTAHTALLTARILQHEGKHSEAATYYEAIAKYFFKDDYYI